MKPISASVLTVGDEITAGEILNSNSKWLAEQLEALGFNVKAHLSVPDDRPLIEAALDFCAGTSEVFIVTGGLGPTSDDFTREVIADWANVSLEFNEEVYKQLEELLLKRNLNIKEAHRQQCEFPAGARLLKNIVGTAHGFYTQSNGKHLFVLPGPPREIFAMWEPSVVPILKSLNAKSATVLYRWICFGAPESEVAEVVEKIIAGKNLKVGYRASKPYVHVKLWIPVNQDPQPLINELNEKLKKWEVHDGKEAKDG